ncbi:tonB-system energizer ExbB [Pseudoxanthomonas putridarboris]|uniref:Biopolymer transport protein ExbB n=1 Tax=Pseudoxanthomonas putridarboris TaxID=752605 RepID=A0ABU9IXX6_9GAMM
MPTTDITVQSMYAQADWVVKSVMWTLVLASVASLSIGLYKGWEILIRRRRMSAALDQLTVASGLEQVKEIPDSAARAMVQTALSELDRYPKARHQSHLPTEGIKERVAAVIQRIGASRQRQLSRGISVLGSVGAAAPFIGLFGTVWGIMNSFIGIAKAQTTNLAVVAPGIAEALLATAFGLVAAIPAVLLYNATVRAIAGYRVKLDDASVQVMCLLSRELDDRGHREDAARKPVGALHGV